VIEMKTYKMIFPIENDKKATTIDNAYYSFCVSYVNQLKETLNFKQTEINKGNKRYIQFSLDMGKTARRKIEERFALKNKEPLNVNEYAVKIPSREKVE